MKRKIAGLLICIVCFTACNRIVDSVASIGKEELSKKDLKKISVNNLYALGVPNYMKEMKKLHDEASLKYANIFKETYTLVLDENKQEFIDVYNDLEYYDDAVTLLKNYEDVQLNSFKESIEDLKITKTKIKVKNIPSSVYEFHGKVDGMEIGYLVGFIEGKENMYLVMSWTLENRFKKYKDTFQIIQESFEFIKENEI